jgi:hypothetical protein
VVKDILLDQPETQAVKDMRQDQIKDLEDRWDRDRGQAMSAVLAKRLDSPLDHHQ